MLFLSVSEVPVVVSWIDCFEPEAKLKITATGLNGSRKKKKTINHHGSQETECSVLNGFLLSFHQHFWIIGRAAYIQGG